MIEELLESWIRCSALELRWTLEERDDEVVVNLEGADGPLVLARHAEVLNAMEYLCNRASEKRGKRVFLDCNGYRAVRTEELKLMALTAAEKVKRLGRPHQFSPMSPEERRIIHLAVADDPLIRTESEGVGENRKVVILPR
ncbi:MAG: R3H domain-containing nucleic acid-binding protein [Acidobacteriota bacterium]